MPPPEEDILASGRQSRASGISGRSRPDDLRHAGDMLGAAAPGVLSMLRTTTDTGDIGSLSVNQSRLPHLNHQPQRKRFHPMRRSDGSTRSNKTSRIKRYSNNSPWETSSGNRGSISSFQTTKTMPIYYNDGLGPSPHPPPMRTLPPNASPAPSTFDGRSYSMTQSHMQQTLAVQRSVSSLRSQASTGRLHRQRTPYAPQRRPPTGFRPVSPAMSDYNTPRHTAAAAYGQRAPMTTYHSDFAYGPPPAPELRSRYPPQMPQYAPRHLPQAMAPPLPMQGYGQAQYMYPPPLMQAHSRQAIMYAPPLRQGYPPQPAFQGRMYPPALESTPPSSGPSSSAPHSSNPSTPQDSHVANVLIDPEAIEAGMGDLPDENSEQMMFSSYIAYTSKTGEGGLDAESPLFELDAEPEMVPNELNVPGSFPEDVGPVPQQHTLDSPDETHISSCSSPSQPPTQPPGGLVQRMKHLLENKREEPPIAIPRARPQRKASEPPVGPPSAVNDTREEFDANVRHGHLGSTSRSEGRITRELIKAMTSPSSTKLDTFNSEIIEPKQTGDKELVLGTAASIRESESEYPSEPEEGTNGDHDDNEVQAPEVSQLEQIPTPRSFSEAKSVSPVISASRQSHHLNQSVHCLADVRSQGPDRDLNPSMIEARAIRNGEEKEVVVEVEPGSMPGEVLDEPSEVGQFAVVSTSLSTPELGASRLSAVQDKRRSERFSRADTDFDELVDANAGVTSDIVTDIAVRFSIPRHTSMAKPNVIRVASVSEHPSSPPQLHQDIHELPSAASPRGSLYVPENVAPLQVDKQQTPASEVPTPTDGADLSSFIRRSFPRRHSALFSDKSDVASIPAQAKAEDKALLQPGRLPGVKEESQEDIASAKSRPIGGSVASIPENSLDDATEARAHLSLSEIRNLPSLNFSQMNLVDQLNAALDDGVSFEALRKYTRHSVVSPSPLRPSSTEALRERYTSFFTKPEDFYVANSADDSESFSVETLMAGRKDEQQRRLMLGNDHDQNLDKASASSKNQRQGSLSPTQLLDVASEAERLTVPSVAGLSDRLSSLLPSLKRLHLDSVIADDEAVEHTIDTIHQLGHRPDTMRSTRSSGVLRSLAAIADDIATNGTHSSAIMAAGPRYNKSLPPLPMETTGDTDQSTFTNTRTEARSTTGSATSRDSRRGIRRTQSENRNSTAALLRPDIPSANNTRRSMTISSPNSRPWNFDENYPWSSEFSLREKERESITSNLLRDAATTPSKNDRTVMSLASRSGATDVDFSSPSEQGLDPTATVTADTLTAQHTRKISKKAASLLGSLSRRAKLSPLRPSTESKRSARRPATSATVLSGKSHASQVHAGDRYPSTALQAPIGYDVDEMRSYFSDENGSRNSSALGVRRRETRSSKLKKRLSDIRFKPEIRIRPASEVHDSAQIVEQANRDSGMGFSLHSAQHGDEGIGSDTDHAAPGVAFYGLEGGHGVPAGMSRVEFRMKRLGERVRSALAKGGALLRRVSGRAKQERLRREQQDWVDVSGSVYSGT